MDPLGGSSVQSVANVRLLPSSFIPSFTRTFSRGHQLPVPLLIYRESHTFPLPTPLAWKPDKTDLYSFDQRGQRSAYAATNLRFRKSTKSLTYVTGFPLIWQTYKVRGNIRDYIVSDTMNRNCDVTTKGNPCKFQFPFPEKRYSAIYHYCRTSEILAGYSIPAGHVIGTANNVYS